MAQLHKTPYRLNASIDEHIATLDKLQADTLALPEGQVEGALIKFQVADGFAYYVVTSEAPLVLQHVPAIDAYQISHAHIRGLRVPDIKAIIDAQRRMASFLASRKR